MNKQQMLARIGSGVRLLTQAYRRPFDLRADEGHLYFVPSSGKQRKQPWSGPMWRGYSVVAMYRSWERAGMPSRLEWFVEDADEHGVGMWHKSYYLATFRFLAGIDQP